MTTEMINNIGDRLVAKMRVVNLYKKKGEYAGNFRKCPFYSEFVGMTQMLKTLGIDFDIDWDANVTQMTAVTVMGKRFDV